MSVASLFTLGTHQSPDGAMTKVFIGAYILAIVATIIASAPNIVTLANNRVHWSHAMLGVMNGITLLVLITMFVVNRMK
jgi:hypothetical protein